MKHVGTRSHSFKLWAQEPMNSNDREGSDVVYGEFDCVLPVIATSACLPSPRACRIDAA